METEIDKIGIGLITCDRPGFFKKSFSSLMHNIQDKPNITYIVINDGKDKLPFSPLLVENTSGYIGVAKSKNIALKNLIKSECKHIFLMEDDIEITNADVFDFYIKASKDTGIKHFNYGLHGNHNLLPNGKEHIRKTIKYPNTDISIDLYSNVLGAFSYYHIDVLKDIGLMDETFYNALEHVDHTYQIIKKGYHPPFRWFADVSKSKNYLKDIVPDHKQSKIRNDENFQQVFKNGLDRFIEKNKFSVVHGYGPQEEVIDESKTMNSLKEIWKRYHQE